MRFLEISPHVVEDTESKRQRLDRLFNERAALRQRRSAALAESDKERASVLTTKLQRLDDMINSLEEGMSPVAAKKARLAQLKADLAELPQNPGSQEGYDALDELRDKIKDLESEIKGLSEAAPAERTSANDPTIAFEEAHQRAQTALGAIATLIERLKIEATRNSRDWGYPGSMAHVATQLEEARGFLGNEER